VSLVVIDGFINVKRFLFRKDMRWSRDEWLVQPKPSIVVSLEDLLVILYCIAPIDSTGIGTDGGEPQKDKSNRSHLERRDVIQIVVEE
jgi:hypothetical protein